VKTRPIDQLVAELRENHAQSGSWRVTAQLCGVVTAAGRPDPGMAYRIAKHGYVPARLETRRRLHLPPVCVKCGQKVKRERHVPAWLEVAVGNLARLEAGLGHQPAESVYARGGKRVVVISSSKGMP
jgi:hypothetical protein